MSGGRTSRFRGTPLQVMVVDDSALVRQVLTAVLQQDRAIQVTTAHDPLIAMDKMKRRRPDVMILDLEMPRMDGLSFLRKIMEEDPIPVVICSGLAARGTEASFQALEAGAVEIVTKPQLGVRDFLYESAVQLIDTVRAASQALRRTPARRGSATSVKPLDDSPAPPPGKRTLRVTTDKVIAIGASTGGTEALRIVLSEMPVDSPGIVVVQHLPQLFTKAFADRLDRDCAISVKEAEDGDRILVGRALIAPGNRHLAVRRSGAHYTVSVADGPLVSRHRPSVDVLFRSVAQSAGPNAVGVIMTGMGDDGADGLLEMRSAGAYGIAQDEASCVVFGMPREAIVRGAVDEIVPLHRLGSAIVRRMYQLHPRANGPAERSRFETNRSG